MANYNLVPQDVEKVSTANREIKTQIPVPESIAIYDMLKENEPESMLGQPPVIWDKAKGVHIFDKWGNKWLDWSSCVLVANVGHGRTEIKNALKKVIDSDLLSTYVFVHERRAELCKMLTQLSPDPKSYRTFLLSTGSEATENAIKLARTYSLKKHGEKKNVIVSFSNAFHGRTLGAQMAGGMPPLKEWIVNHDKDMVNVSFPDGFRNTKTDFADFLAELAKLNITPDQISAVMSESYQGVGPHFFPDAYAEEMGKYCVDNDILIIMDEVQSGFGRTGKMFCYEHYNLTPDLITCGKGISSSLPLSAVIGRADVMGLYPAGSMTSTHSASPLPVAASIANLNILEKENLVEKSAKLGVIMKDGLQAICDKHSGNLGHLFSRGLVSGIQVVEPGTTNPDPATAVKINEMCFQKGLLMFSPVGIGGGCIKIAPPLIITEEQIKEGLSVLDEVCDIVLG